MADQETLDVAIREQTGSAAARRLRATGMTPGVVYGHNQAPVAVAFAEREFVQHLARHGTGSLVQLRYPGKKQGPLAMVSAVQRDPLSGRLLNVDFQAVTLTEKVRASVRVVLDGEPAGHRQGGVLEHLMHEVHVECQAGQIPPAIHVDVSPLGVGGNVHVKDLVVPEGVHVLDAADEVVALVAAPTKAAAVEEAAQAVPEPETVAETTEETA